MIRPVRLKHITDVNRAILLIPTFVAPSTKNMVADRSQKTPADESSTSSAGVVAIYGD